MDRDAANSWQRIGHAEAADAYVRRIMVNTCTSMWRRRRWRERRGAGPAAPDAGRAAGPAALRGGAAALWWRGRTCESSMELALIRIPLHWHFPSRVQRGSGR